MLQPSLADVPYIALPLLSWRIEEEQKVSQQIPLSSSELVDVYAANKHRLVILGDEGAGKTTLLLELLRGLLQRAEQDEQAPIPVMLHLSSWATKCQPLEKWLVEEWQTLYPACAFKAGKFLLLLDGLDAVRTELLDICLQSINTYQETYNQIPLVLCCRNADYERFQLPAQPHRVVQIQLLSDE